MFGELFFKLIDIWIFLRHRNWQVIEQGTYTDGTSYTQYTYNSQKYTCVGCFPPTKPRGFFVPVRRVLLDGSDVTQVVKSFIGPVGTLTIDPGYIFYTTRYTFTVSLSWRGVSFRLHPVRVKGDMGTRRLVIENIFGVQSEIGAR